MLLCQNGISAYLPALDDSMPFPEMSRWGRACRIGRLAASIGATERTREIAHRLSIDIRALATDDVVDDLARSQVSGNDVLGEIGVSVDRKLWR